MLRAHVVCVDVAVQTCGVVAEAALDLGADDRRDLLRRPGRASTAREAVGGCGDVEDLDDDGLSHVAPLYPSRTAPHGADAHAHAAARALLFDDGVPVGSGIGSALDGTIAPSGRPGARGSPGERSHGAVSMANSAIMRPAPLVVALACVLTQIYPMGYTCRNACDADVTHCMP